MNLLTNLKSMLSDGENGSVSSKRVITFMGAFLVALAWRSWTIDGNDLVEDDVEDRLIARRGESDHLSDTPVHEDVDVTVNGEEPTP